MRGFLLDEQGDIVIDNGSIALVSGDNLTAQKLKTTLGTNKGEWFLNENEGIYFSYMLGKGITDDMRLAQVKDACYQVDESLYVSSFETQNDKRLRTSKVVFTAKGDNETEITLSEVYGDETNANAASKLAVANQTLSQYRNATDRLARRLDGK